MKEQFVMKQSKPSVLVGVEEAKIHDLDGTFDTQETSVEDTAVEQFVPPSKDAVLEETQIHDLDGTFDTQSTLMRVITETNDDFTTKMVQANHKRIARSAEMSKSSKPKQLGQKVQTGFWAWLMANKTMVMWIAVFVIMYRSHITSKSKGTLDEPAEDLHSENLKDLTAISNRIATALSDNMVADNSSLTGAGFLVEFDEYGDRHQTDLVELQKMVRRAAAALKNHGCSNQKVLLCTPPGVHYYVTLLSCLRHGVVVIPVPPAALKNFQQIRQLVAKHEVEMVVTTREEMGEWKRQEGSDKVLSARQGREMNFIQAQDLVSFPHEMLKSSINSQPLQPTDCACLLTEDSKEGMVNKIWTCESLDYISEAWIAAGISRRCAVGSLGQHTDGASIGLFLSTLTVGGQFIVSSQTCQHSKRMVEHMGITHCYFPDRMQLGFDWGAARGMFAAITGAGEENASAVAYLSKVFIGGVPVPSFVEGAKENRVTVQSIYSSALHFGGAYGGMKTIAVHKDALWHDGNAVVAAKNCASDRQEVLYSCGKVRNGVVVRPIEREEVASCLLEEEPQSKLVGDQTMNVVGEIWVQPSLCIGEERYGNILSMGLEDDLVQTGDFGFISSSNNHLYVLSKQDDFVQVQGLAKSCAMLEDRLRSQVEACRNVSIIRLEQKDRFGAVVICEVANSKDCEIIAFKIRDALLADEVPLVGIGLVPSGELPTIAARDEVWRAQLKLQWNDQKLKVHLDGWWEMKDDMLVNLDQLSLSCRLAKAEDSDSETEDLLHGVYS